MEHLWYTSTSRHCHSCLMRLTGAAAKDPAALFEPLDVFLRWRVGLQERSIALMGIKDYVGDGLNDPKQGVQVSTAATSSPDPILRMRLADPRLWQCQLLQDGPYRQGR